MADQKLTALTATTSPASTDIVYVVVDPGTTPASKKSTLANLRAAIGTVATDPLWDAAGDLAVGTGADTAGRLAKGAAGGALSMINGAVAWNSGTSMPANKATGDRYWRTDLGLEFYWDGTRWLSTTLYISNIPQYIENTNVQPFSTSPAYPLRAVAISDLYDMYIIDFRSTIRVNTTNNGTNYWTCTLENYPAATALASFNTSAKSADTIYRVTTAAGQLMGASNLIIWLHLVKTNSPGTVDILTAQYTYRLVGT